MNTVAVFGAYGKMGQPICESLRKCGYEVKEVDIKNANFKSLDELDEKVDLVVDFSTRNQSDDILNYCERTKTKLVMGTTGQDDCFEEKLESAAKHIPVIKCNNFSENVLKFTYLAKEMSQHFDGEIAVVEAHHKNKLDAPSGTAKHIIQEMLAQDNNKTDTSSSNKFENHVINSYSLRGGTIFGRHEIHYFADDEEIVLTHTSYSRKPFVNGVVRAVNFLMQQNKPARYRLEDVFGMNK